MSLQFVTTQVSWLVGGPETGKNWVQGMGLNLLTVHLYIKWHVKAQPKLQWERDQWDLS